MVVIIPNQLRIMSNGGGCGDYILNLLPLNSLKAASAAVDCGLWRRMDILYGIED